MKVFSIVENVNREGVFNGSYSLGDVLNFDCIAVLKLLKGH